MCSLITLTTQHLSNITLRYKWNIRNSQRFHSWGAWGSIPGWELRSKPGSMTEGKKKETSSWKGLLPQSKCPVTPTLQRIQIWFFIFWKLLCIYSWMLNHIQLCPRMWSGLQFLPSWGSLFLTRDWTLSSVSPALAGSYF